MLSSTDEYIESYYGFVKEKEDAVALVEACLAGKLSPIKDMHFGFHAMKVRSGSVCVFAEHSSKTLRVRWRDGWQWSSSKISGPFLLYRQVEQLEPGISYQPLGAESCPLFRANSLRPNTRLLPGGMAKRTITLTARNGCKYRIINYFYPQHVEHHFNPTLPRPDGSLKVPTQQPEFQQFVIRANSSTPATTITAIIVPSDKESPLNSPLAIPSSFIAPAPQAVLDPGQLLARFERSSIENGGLPLKLTLAYFRSYPNWYDYPIRLAPLSHM
ncbi:Gti1/Pac2 family-domain-containing protein [Chytriomyces cf. hyalinus JEL632]|nr:Gti1/Pac2 family-domain-containing protein [Chytriomyces cf. hyalinus JEL632]